MLNGKCYRIYSQSTVDTPQEMPQNRNHQLVNWFLKKDQVQLKGPEAASPSLSSTCPPQRKALCVTARMTSFHIYPTKVRIPRHICKKRAVPKGRPFKFAETEIISFRRGCCRAHRRGCRPGRRCSSSGRRRGHCPARCRGCCRSLPSA